MKKHGFTGAFFWAVFFIFFPVFVHAADEGITASTDLVFQASSRPEAKIGITQSFIFPFLQGRGPLTSGNNIRTNLTVEVSPISLIGIGQLIWTPIAFLEINGGGRLGSGWNMALGDGIGINRPVGDPGSGPGPDGARKAEIDGNAFDGIQWSAWIGGAFQFDLAALFPGPWNHVVFRAQYDLRYSAYTRAGNNDSWVFENDREYMNGWTMHPTMVFGYQMPLSPVLDFVGFMAEGDFNLYNIPGKEAWGGNLGRWTLSSVFNFSFTPQFSTMFAIQLRTKRNFMHTDFDNKDEYWYQDLKISNHYGNQRLLFHRVALAANLKIR